MSKLRGVFVIVGFLLAACAPTPLPPNAPSNNPNPPQATIDTSVAPTVESQSPASTDPAFQTQSNAPHTSTVDLTRLTVGTGKYSQNPQVGYVYSCMTQFNGGGAQGTGNWINGDGTWDATKKAIVDGSITWPHSFTITVQGNQRVFSSNDLPDHITGNFPIVSNDDAYTYDRNPNSIQGQSIQFSVPVNSMGTVRPTCVGGEVGIMLSGVVLFNAFDAGGRDAPAYEAQDACDGHPQSSGFYHYHSLSDCFQDTAAGHSALMGYAFDGFGIYGYYGEDGKELTNEDLDACHGHTHVIEWDGQPVEKYHYHATHEFPYVVGCFKGTPSVRALSVEGGQNGGNQPGGQQGGGQDGPPQEAINACIGLSQGTACSFNAPNGTISGTCGAPPNSSPLACVPIGGPP